VYSSAGISIVVDINMVKFIDLFWFGVIATKYENRTNMPLI